MKKLFSSLLMLTFVFAFSSMASASILYEEDFSVPPGHSIAASNWIATGDAYIQVPMQNQDLLYMTSGPDFDKNGVRNIFSFDMEAGKKYYAYVDVVGFNMNGISDPQLTLGFFAGNQFLHAHDFTITNWVGSVDNVDEAKGAMTRLEVVFDSAQYMHKDLSLALFGDSRGGAFVIGNVIWSDAPLSSPVPIPGAVLLLGSGLAGLAAVKRRLK